MKLRPLPDEYEFKGSKEGMEHIKMSSLPDVPPEQRVRAAVAREYGAYPEDVQTSGGVDRFFGEFMGDTPEEQLKYFEQNRRPNPKLVNVPGVGQFPAYQRPGEDPTVFNLPGFQGADIGGFAGQNVLPVVAAGANPMGAAGSLTNLATRFIPRIAAAETGRQGVQELAGTGAQTGMEMLGQTGMIAAMEGAGGLLGRGLAKGANVVRGAGLEPDPVQRELLLAARKYGQDPAAEVDPLLMSQISGGPVLERLEKQAASTWGTMKNFLRGQRESIVRSGEQWAQKGEERIGKELMQQAGRNYDTLMKRATGDYARVMSPEAMGRIQADAYQDFYTNSKQAVSQAYKEADKYGIPEIKKADGSVEPNPDYEDLKFDLTVPYEKGGVRGASQSNEIMALGPVTQKEGNIVDLAGKPLTVENVREYVDVADAPAGRIRQVANLIDRLADDAAQPDYRVVKELRTQIGEAIDVMPWQENNNIRIGKNLYGRLSNVLMNPAGGAKNYPGAIRKATQMAKHRFEMNDNIRVRQMIQGNQTPGELALEFESNPVLWNNKVREVFQKHSPDNFRDVTDYLKHKILTSQDPQATVKRIAEENPQMHNFINPRPGDSENFARSLSQVKRLRSGRMGQAVQNINRHIEVAEQLLPDKLGAEETRLLVSQIGSTGRAGAKNNGKELLRMAAWSRLIGKSTAQKEGDSWLDPTKMADAMKWVKESGIREHLFTPKDIERMEGLFAFAKLTKKQAMDTGTSLEQAAAIANLKHPATFMNGVIALQANRMTGMVLMNPHLANWWFKTKVGTGKKAWDNKWARRSGHLLGAMGNYIMDLDNRISE